MYPLLWRMLPGPKAVKVIELVILAVVVVAILFTWVFPAIAPLMPFNSTTIGEDG